MSSSNSGTKMKRVTDPLDDKVKARIIGWDRAFDPRYASSGSEHSIYDEEEVAFSNLSELFYGCTLEEKKSNEVSPETDESDSEQDVSTSITKMNSNDEISNAVLLISSIQQDSKDEFQNMLKMHVLKAIKLYSFAKSNIQTTRRNVMGCLRNLGYNAGICKTKWETSGGLTAGNYEFIDVVRTEYGSVVRYFIDVDFAAELEIARPTSGYEKLMEQVPVVFVGKIDELKKVLGIVCEAAKRSLKSRDLLLPPWKKQRFMMNKWLASYKRTTNVYPTTSFCASKQQIYASGVVKCRAVGFDVGGQLFPARSR